MSARRGRERRKRVGKLLWTDENMTGPEIEKNIDHGMPWDRGRALESHVVVMLAGCRNILKEPRRSYSERE